MSKKLLYVSIFSCAWALNIFLNKLALNAGAHALTYTIQTSFLSSLLICAYLLKTQGKKVFHIPSGIILRLIGLGITVGAAYILGILSLQFTTSINYGFLIKSTILFTTILAWIVLNEQLTKSKIILLIVFIVGAYLISTGGKVLLPHFGDLLVLAAAFCFSSAVIVTKPLFKHINSDIISGYRLIFSSLVLVLLIPVFHINIFVVQEPLNILVVGFSTVILALYLNKTLSVASASYLTMMSMLTPVVVSILGFFVLNESMNSFQIFGGILTIACGVIAHKLEV